MFEKYTGAFGFWPDVILVILAIIFIVIERKTYSLIFSFLVFIIPSIMFVCILPIPIWSQILVGIITWLILSFGIIQFDSLYDNILASATVSAITLPLLIIALKFINNSWMSVITLSIPIALVESALLRFRHRKLNSSGDDNHFWTHLPMHIVRMIAAIPHYVCALFLTGFIIAGWNWKMLWLPFIMTLIYELVVVLLSNLGIKQLNLILAIKEHLSRSVKNSFERTIYLCYLPAIVITFFVLQLFPKWGNAISGSIEAPYRLEYIVAVGSFLALAMILYDFCFYIFIVKSKQPSLPMTDN